MAGEGTESLLAKGREAIRVADWDAASAAFEEALERERSPEALDGLSEAAHLGGDYDRAIELKEQAFAAYRDAGRPAEAAGVAHWLAFLEATYRGNYAMASGWVGRAESTLEGVAECAAHGWLILLKAPFSDDAGQREQLALSALSIAKRFCDSDLEFEALALLGESYVARGRINEGMGLLDQAMAAVASGEISGHEAVGEICCRLLSACEHAMDLKRADEWMAMAERFAVWQAFVRPTCRTHYGGILIGLGRWEQAEAELEAAIKAFENGYRGDRTFPVVRLADLRARQGRFEEAERLLEGSDWHASARVTAARIALARGDVSLAEELSRLCLEGGADDDPKNAPALEVLLNAQLAVGEVAAARVTLDSLHALATLGGARLAAGAELAAGLVSGAAGEPDAVPRLKQAVELYARIGLPLETARARLALARALAPGAADAARSEAQQALEAFDRLGAAHDANGAAELLRGLGGKARSWPRGNRDLTKRETEVLALLAEGLPNAEIAERLVVSVRTAEHHVANVLAKLGVRSRSEAATHALRARTKDT